MVVGTRESGISDTAVHVPPVVFGFQSGLEVGADEFAGTAGHEERHGPDRAWPGVVQFQDRGAFRRLGEVNRGFEIAVRQGGSVNLLPGAVPVGCGRRHLVYGGWKSQHGDIAVEGLRNFGRLLVNG
ncbi:hypothetical protein [Novosphingobium sp. ST904]|uniref:hypothetical protein n=1 Tax=Novosphingobium sp. ST904 TaxID=1684385 RepID=UPI001E4218B0|nr:hypothetical protein [Novosphingobium sp. ST904]